MYATDTIPDAAEAAAEIATADVLARAADSAKAPKRQKHKIDPTVKWDFLGKVMADHALTPGAIRVAFALLDRYNHDMGDCFPGIDTLMADTGLGRTAVIDGLHGADKGRQNGLISRGWFIARKRPNQSNRYSPNLAKVGLTGREGERLAGYEKLDVRKSELPEGSGQPDFRTPDVRKSEPGTAGNPNPNPMKGTQGSDNPATERGRPSRGSGEVNEASNDAVASRAGSASSPHDSVLEGDRAPKPWIEPAVLDEWWDKFKLAYPHKAGLPKAKRMFCKVMLERRVAIEPLLAAVERYHDGIVNTEIAFANATAWLHEERWKPESMFQSPKKPVRAKRRSSALPTTSESNGILIDENWTPSPEVWANGVRLAGEEMAEEHLDTFRSYNERRRVENPDAEWLSYCEPY